MKSIIEKIRSLVEEITFKSVTNDEALYTSGLIDSMGTVELAILMEDEFNIKIDTRDIIEIHFDDINKLEKYVMKKING